VGDPLYLGSDNGGYRFSRRCLRSTPASSTPAVYRTTARCFPSIDRFTEMMALPSSRNARRGQAWPGNCFSKQNNS
jgi:hypothetical protein